MFERILFEQIEDIWRSAQGDTSSLEEKIPPELEAIRAVVETSFFGSLRKEEGRPVEFTLVLMSEEDLVSTKFWQEVGANQALMKFQQPLPLNVDSIKKIAGAFDKNTTAIAVESLQSESGAQYQIWGALFHGPSTNLLNEVNTGSTLQPDFLMVTTASTGSLAISRGGRILGHFESGEFSRAIPSPFTSTAMGKYVTALVDRKRSGDPLYVRTYLKVLELVLAEASRRGHGGTIIVIPSADVGSLEGHFDRTYSFPGDLGISRLLDHTLTLSKSDPSSYDMTKRLLMRRLEVLAQLANIDGALIITSEWEVLAFGAKLTVKPKWTKDVVVGPDAFGGGGKIFKRSKLGTRHNSAIDLIGACQTAIGFVISEDGPIRGLAKRDAETVLCWPDCRVSLSK